LNLDQIGLSWRKLILAAPVLALTAVSPDARAEGGEACASVTRENVARCVVRASAQVLAEREAIAAARARRTAVSPWLPSSPTLAFSIAHRAGSEGRSDALNYSASLSQELELTGRRASRIRAAEEEVDARKEQATDLARRVAAEGYAAYFEVIAARERALVVARLDATADQVARVTRGRAEAGIASPLDADVADAASLRAKQARLEAERELRSASARLASLLARDPERDTVPVAGALEPLSGLEEILRSTAARAGRDRPLLRALASDRRAWEARAEAFRRARVPSLTVQAFAQNDGYNERVVGAGVSVPIPLPGPVGHLYAGEIREADAMARQSAARSEALRRELDMNLAIAATQYESRRAEAALFAPDRTERSARTLSEIATEIGAGRLSVRDAVVAQQQMIDALRGAVEARRALCLASIELAVAAGVPLEGAPR
jgi:cobalt-zinc-cadmium efflux system outer membrane protein